MNTDTKIEIVSKLEIETKKSGLLPERALPLVDIFKPLAVTAAEVFTRADVVTEKEPKKARSIRLELKDVRVAVEKLRKQEKAESLKLGSAIDSVAKVIFNVIEPYETKMEQIEKAEEIAAAKAKAERAELRRKEIEPFGMIVDELLLLECAPEAWASLVAGAKQAHEKKLADEAKAIEDARIAEEKRAAEEKRLREENERLQKAAAEAERARKEAELKAAEERCIAEEKARKEREIVEAERRKAEAKAAAERAEIERKARAERETAEAVARKEREAREKLEAAERERIVAEGKRLQEEAAAKAKMERAPDREKLLEFLKQFTAIKSPDLKTIEGKEILKSFAAKHEAAIRTTINEINSL